MERTSIGWRRSPTTNTGSEVCDARWGSDELRKIAEADDLHVTPFREDGSTYGTPTWIWSVAVDGALFVRGYNEQTLDGTGPPSSKRPGALSPQGFRKK